MKNEEERSKRRKESACQNGTNCKFMETGCWFTHTKGNKEEGQKNNESRAIPVEEEVTNNKPVDKENDKQHQGIANLFETPSEEIASKGKESENNTASSFLEAGATKLLDQMSIPENLLPNENNHMNIQWKTC